MNYRIAGMFGGVDVWRITNLKVIGEIKFGEWIDFGHKVLLLAKIWLVKVWRITHDSPNIPAIRYLDTKVPVYNCFIHYSYTILTLFVICTFLFSVG